MKRWLLFFFFLIIFSNMSCTYDDQNSQVISLTGEWEFYRNRLISPDDFTNAYPHELVGVPHNWREYPDTDPIGYATYRYTIDNAHSDRLYALNIPGMAGAYRLWVNGVLVTENGTVSTNLEQVEFTLSSHIITVPVYTNRFTIILQIANNEHPFGGFRKAIRFGESSLIYTEREKRIALMIFITGGMFFMSLYLGGLFLFGKRNPAILFIALYSLIMTLYNLITGRMFLYTLIPALSYPVHLRIELLTIYIGMIVFAQFFKQFYHQHISEKWLTLIQIIFIIPVVPALFFPVIWLFPIRIVYQFFLILTSIVYFFILIKSRLNREKGAGWMILGFGIFTITVINDILVKNMLIHSSEMGSYGYFVFLSCLTINLSWEITRAYRSVVYLSEKLNTEMALKRQNLEKLQEQEEELRDHRENLEDMIRERTRELSETMNELTVRSGEIEKAHTQMELAFELLDNVSAKLGATFDVKEIAEVLLEQARKYMPFPDGSVLLYNNDTQLLEFVSGIGSDQETRVAFRAGEGVAGYVFQHDVPVFVEDTSQDSRFITRQTNPRSLYCLPIHSRDEVIGVLNLGADEKTIYTDENLKFLNILIAFGGVAMENASLYERLERKVKQRTKELEEEQQKLRKQNKIIEDELNLARIIQMQFIPSTCPPNMAFYYKPMYQVGGDFVDFISLPDGQIGIFLSDVSGHGIPAALLTSIIKSLMLEFSQHMIDPARFLMFLNNRLLNFTAGNFVTALYGIYNPTEKNFTFSSAGHNAPYFLRDQELMTINMENRGLALGVYNNSQMLHFEKLFKNSYIQLVPGDKLILYTDGLIEAVNINEIAEDHPQGIPDFESTMLSGIIKTNSHLSAQEMIDKLVEELIRFRGDENFDDDVCIVCFDVTDE